MTEQDECQKCGVKTTPEERDESPIEELICRKCIARLVRMKDFKEHIEDDDYWNSDNVPQWEWWAWRIANDFEEITGIYQRRDILLATDLTYIKTELEKLRNKKINIPDVDLSGIDDCKDKLDALATQLNKFDERITKLEKSSKGRF